MLSPNAMADRLRSAFTPGQASVLTDVIWQAYNELVKASDLAELKEVVQELAEAQRDLADAQKRTEARVDVLGQRMGELAEAQRRTDEKMGALAEAQKRTDERMGALAEAQRRTDGRLDSLAHSMQELAQAMKETRREFGGVTASVSYALENEAYRLAPRVLAERYGVTLEEKLVRTTIRGEEVNLFGRGRRDGREVWVVGEAKLRVDVGRGRKGARDLFTQLETKVAAVRAELGDVDVVRVLVTHFATPEFLTMAQERNTLVIQSFEW
ncbi:MAG: hypothetical protein AB1578_05645 [Thermodesulfobacteriota bacterium]|jgi:predicted nuclease with TOPRIM domain